MRRERTCGTLSDALLGVFSRDAGWTGAHDGCEGAPGCGRGAWHIGETVLAFMLLTPAGGQGQPVRECWGVKERTAAIATQII